MKSRCFSALRAIESAEKTDTRFTRAAYPPPAPAVSEAGASHYDYYEYSVFNHIFLDDLLQP
jgi:hypothetical protein